MREVQRPASFTRSRGFDSSTAVCVLPHALRVGTRGSFLIRRQRGHPGVVLPLVNFEFGKSLGRNAIRIEPD